MSDRLHEIAKRINDWKVQKAVGTEAWFDGVRHYEPLLCDDIEWLLAEVTKWQERAKTQNPIIEIRGEDGSVWVRIDGLRAPTLGGDK